MKIAQKFITSYLNKPFIFEIEQTCIIKSKQKSAYSHLIDSYIELILTQKLRAVLHFYTSIKIMVQSIKSNIFTEIGATQTKYNYSQTSIIYASLIVICVPQLKADFSAKIFPQTPLKHTILIIFIIIRGPRLNTFRFKDRVLPTTAYNRVLTVPGNVSLVVLKAWTS